MFRYNPYDELGPFAPFTLESPDFRDGEFLALPQYGAGQGGSDTSPELRWSGFPPETRSFALTCFDPDAPTASGFWHWAVFNIPASVTALARGAGAYDSVLLPESATTLPNEKRERRFIGAGAPEGTGVHRYIFAVHALDVERLSIPEEAGGAILGFNVNFHAVGRALLTGLGEFNGAHRA